MLEPDSDSEDDTTSHEGSSSIRSHKKKKARDLFAGSGEKKANRLIVAFEVNEDHSFDSVDLSAEDNNMSGKEDEDKDPDKDSFGADEDFDDEDY